MRKKMKMTIAATRAPTSGRARIRFDRPNFTRLDASDGAAFEVSFTGVLITAPVVLSSEGPDRGRPGPTAGQRVFCFTNGRVASMLVLSTNDGPVSTALPPPMMLPFFL